MPGEAAAGLLAYNCLYVWYMYVVSVHHLWKPLPADTTPCRGVYVMAVAVWNSSVLRNRCVCIWAIVNVSAKLVTFVAGKNVIEVL